jgi:hypothetical protein
MLFRVTDSYSDSVAEEIACRTRLQSLVHAAILRILTLISPTLRTLALQAGWYSLLPLPIPLHLPALVELAIGGLWQSNIFGSDTFSTIGCHPSLRRLMLTGFLEINDLAGIIDNIRIFAPSITHLCIPAYVLPLHLLSLMLPILQKGMDRVIEPSGNATFPSTLRMLLMHDSDIAYSEPNLSARLSKLQEDCRVVFVDRK